MKYSILGFNQEKVLQLRREETQNNKVKVVAIDVVDLLILQEIADFINRKKIIKYIVNDKTFCYVKYAIIIEDLPILNIKQQALVDRLNKLCSFSLLEKHVIKNQTGSFPAFRIGDAYESIVYSDDNSHMYQTTSANVSNYKCDIYIDNNNNNLSTINNKKEDINISSKKESKKQIIQYTSEFEKAFIATGRKGSKKNAFKRWLTLSEEDKEKVFAHIPFYYKSNDRQFLKDFEGYLNGRYFENVVYSKNGNILYDPDREKGNIPYTPICEGSLSWNDYYKCYLYVGFWDGHFMPDGYTDENRPDGASVMLNNGRGTIVWNKEQKKWEKQ